MYGVVYEWDEISITWYDSMEEALDNAVTGDMVIIKIMEVK